MDKRKNTELSLLPEEIVLFQILPKVPVKSLLRFRCVCKQWRSVLTSPSFAKIHLHHVTTTTTNNEKVVFFLNGSRNFQTLDCHEDGLIATPPRCYPFEASSAFLVATPVNGLVLVCVGTTFRLTDMILWNPLTGEYKTISRPPFDTKCYYTSLALELYHTCSDDDYKILCITADRDVYIYSLKSNSWRKLESTQYYLERIPYAAAAGDDDNNLLDEKLHFLRPLPLEVDDLTRRYIVARLDLKTEKFTKIALPPSCLPAGELGLAVVRGCIQLTVVKGAHGLPNTLIIEVWQMNDRDWTKMMNISYSRNHNPMHPKPKRHSMRPLYLMRNGNFIGYTVNGICKVDPEKKAEDDFCSDLEIAMLPRIYIETFVSPNQYVS